MTYSEVTPHIFGKPMERVATGVNPYWSLDVANVIVNIRKMRGNNRTYPWQAFISTPYGSDRLCTTRQEAEAFLEAELRNMRDRFVKEVPND